MPPAICVDNLSKRYQIGTSRGSPDRQLREIITDGVKNGWDRVWRRARVEPKDTDRGEFWALKDVSFEVKAGEVIGIIGRNGAGKSTLLKILSRIVEPTSGRARVSGKMASLLEVGTGFHPELTGRENIYLNGSILGMSRRDIAHRFDEIVAFSEIEKFLDTPVKRYSSGMYVRLAFAVAAHLDPEILVIDEVLAVGDAQFQEKCLGKIGDVAKGGRTVLFVSHNMGAIKLLTTRCILLRGGGLTLDGSPDAAISEYVGRVRTSHEMTGDVSRDVSQYRRSKVGSNAEVLIQDVYASTQRIRRSSGIKAGEPISISAVVQANRRVTGAAFDFVIFDARQNCVAIVYSYDNGVRITLEKGLQTVRCMLPMLPLSPGDYYVDVGIAQATGVLSWDVLLKVPLFTIVDDLGDLEWHNRPWGALHLRDASWDVSALSPTLVS